MNKKTKIVVAIQTLLSEIEGNPKFARLYEESSNVIDELMLEWTATAEKTRLTENIVLEPFNELVQDAFKS